MASRRNVPPLRSNTLQNSLLSSRRWSTSAIAPSINLFKHYIDGTNQNDSLLRDHRKLLCMTAEGRSRGQLQSTLNTLTSKSSANEKILEWTRDKYRSRKRNIIRHRKADKERDMTSPGPTMTRKTTISRLSDRTKSRDSSTRRRSQDSVTLSGSESEKKPPSIRTFTWCCRIVKAICKLGLDMQKLSIHKTEQTALSELYYVSSNHNTSNEEEEESQILYFDKTLFSRKRATSRVPEWAQNLMINKPENRKPEEVQRLKHLLMGMRSFREKFTDSMQTKMCEVVRYTKCDKGRVILRQGHYGQDFYFIFSGSVFIQIDIMDPRTQQMKASTENIIRSGESFGEIALLGDGTRSASVICREPTELCQIDKDTFLEICPALVDEQLAEKIQFAKQFEIFSTWSDESLKQICFMSQVLYIPHGRVIELDWSSSLYVYFIMQGRVSLIKKFEVTEVVSDELEQSHYGEESVNNRDNDDENDDDTVDDIDENINQIMEVTSYDKDNHYVQFRTYKRFACVGTLKTGQATDLRILLLEPPEIPSLTLLSEGARVLRVATRVFARFAPRRYTEDYLKRHYVPMTIPGTKSLVARYVREESWRLFRRRVVDTLERERTGHMLATTAASVKGTTGWARWPGFDPLAEEKCSLLSEKGTRSKTDEFPIAIPPSPRRRRRTDASPSRAYDFMQRRVATIPEIVTKSTSRTGINKHVPNDRSNVLYPPVKRNLTTLRRSLITREETVK